MGGTGPARARHLPPADRLEGLHAVGELFRFHGDFEQARTAKRAELTILRGLGETGPRLAAALTDLAGVALMERDLGVAATLADEALELRRRSGDPAGIAHALAAVAAATFFRGEFASARETYRTVAAMREQDGHVDDLAGAIMMVAECSRRLGDLASAATDLRRSLALFRQLDERFSVIEWLDEAAGLVLRYGDPELAATLLGAAEHCGRRLEIPIWDPDDRERTRELAREGLGEDAFDDAYRRGAGLELDEALDLALERLAPSPLG